MAAFLPILRIVLERRDGKLVVTEVDFDTSLALPSQSSPTHQSDETRTESSGHKGLGSK